MKMPQPKSRWFLVPLPATWILTLFILLLYDYPPLWERPASFLVVFLPYYSFLILFLLEEKLGVTFLEPLWELVDETLIFIGLSILSYIPIIMLILWGIKSPGKIPFLILCCMMILQLVSATWFFAVIIGMLRGDIIVIDSPFP